MDFISSEEQINTNDIVSVNELNDQESGTPLTNYSKN